MSNVANDWLDAADKRVPTLSINARRKFFHGLAVVMFLPGVAVDVRGNFFPGLLLFMLMRKKILLAPLACFHASIFQRSICFVYLRGICSILCTIPDGRVGSFVHE